ncbi:cyclin-domain-containing protein [Gongronella butleri]|nr:cyclin-domain-containing protein [Gongronella butleri]
MVSHLPAFNLVYHPIEHTITLFSALLDEITRHNDNFYDKRPTVAVPFHSSWQPESEVQTYLLRIQKYCPFSNEALLSLIIYFDRLALNGAQLRINSWNVHRLLIAGLMIATKFHTDIHLPNSRFAKIGGIPVRELNVLEVEFLKLIDFRVNVTLEDMQRYGTMLVQRYSQHTRVIYVYAPCCHHQHGGRTCYAGGRAHGGQQHPSQPVATAKRTKHDPAPSHEIDVTSRMATPPVSDYHETKNKV